MERPDRSRPRAAERSARSPRPTVDSILASVSPLYKKRFDAFMLTHGRHIADAATWTRLVAAPLVAGLIIAGETDKAKLAYAVGAITDFVDGPAARRSKDGATRNGGKLDQRVDKVFATLTELALVRQGLLSPPDAAIRAGRDALMTGVRKLYDDAGVDTKAVMAGKLAVTVQSFADYYALTRHARRHPRLNRAIQTTATLGKVASFAANVSTWEQTRREAKKAQRRQIVTS